MAGTSGDDPTQLGADTPTVTGPRTPSGSDPTRLGPSSSSGWLTSSGSIDHGRFPPGTVLDNRYRVVGLLGRGGMGEVYRADDLRLGQPVALKFLPADLGRDATRLAQFHNEVRTARQVSHANVCRVYDIGEVEQQLYLSMEYVDGEDLASLLRRIGRLPEDKAVEISRQICAGLAAAHERGVIHRDLKPANVMLDGSGRVRIMDFSLASVGHVTDVRAGTPAYMAPEQLAGKEVTAKSDVYALGLVLYELFTGRRAYDAKNLGELVEQHASGTITAPTDLVKTLDPTIERAILRCLEKDPARRPASPLAVAAALPGGDPLAAALAAGETPSPEMVAAVGGDAATLSPLAGLGWLVGALALLFACAAVEDRTSILSRTPVSKPPAVLLDRAEEIRRSLGFADAPVDQASGFLYHASYLNWSKSQGSGRSDWADLRAGQPESIRFWYRTSASPIVPVNPYSNVTPDDPAFVWTDTVLVETDMAGRLVKFIAAPPEVEAARAAAGPDWNRLVAAAGFDPAALTEVAPGRTPVTFADSQRAWQGVVPGTKHTVRLEAAAYRGRPVFFQVVGPWTPAPRDTHVAVGSNQTTTANVIFVLLILAQAAVFARMNIRSGRADRRGAFRVAGLGFVVITLIWIFNDHVRNINEERVRFFDGLALALFVGAAMWLIYLALEPFVRRSWPTMLVGWSRVLGGRVRDAVVGCELLLGCAVGVTTSVIGLAVDLVPALNHGETPMPHQPDISALMGTRFLIRMVLSSVSASLQQGLIAVLVFVLFRELFRNIARWVGQPAARVDRIGTIAAVTAVLIVAAINNTNSWTVLVLSLLVAGLQLAVMLRVGLLASCVMYFVDFTIGRAPLTLDGSRYFVAASWDVMALVALIAAVGFWLARADEPLLTPRTADSGGR